MSCWNMQSLEKRSPETPGETKAQEGRGRSKEHRDLGQKWEDESLVIVLPLACKPLWGFGFFICNEGVGLRLLWALTSYNFVILINPWMLGAGNLATRSSFWCSLSPIWSNSHKSTSWKDVWGKKTKAFETEAQGWGRGMEIVSSVFDMLCSR